MRMVIFIYFFGAITSCKPNALTITPPVAFASPSAIPIPTRTRISPPTPQPTNTQSPQPSYTPNQPTFQPTETPTITPEPTPIPLLTIRHPSKNELESYLMTVSSETIPFDRPFTTYFKLIYEDVNGDEEDDLIVSDFLLVAVFTWVGNQYNEPLLYQMPIWKYSPASRVYLEDWTNDGVPEIIFDVQDDAGGTGLISYHWKKFIIHCAQEQKPACNSVWTGHLVIFSADYNAGGLDLFQSKIERIVTEDSVSIKIITNSFAVYDSWGWYFDIPIVSGSNFSPIAGIVDDDYRVDSLNVFATTLTTFTWNGQFFELQNTEVIEPTYRIDSQTISEATNITENIAKVIVESETVSTYQNDTCQVFVDEILIGAPFGCKQNFTTVNWQDITNDGIAELTIFALSGLLNPVGEELTDKGCVHQRFIAYQWIGSQLNEIANITGCVVQSDLYGVRIEDIEGDGQVEILAADSWFTETICELPSSEPILYSNCWFEWGHGDEVYKWNGIEFVYWSLLSE